MILTLFLPSSFLKYSYYIYPYLIIFVKSKNEILENIETEKNIILNMFTK